MKKLPGSKGVGRLEVITRRLEAIVTGLEAIALGSQRSRLKSAGRDSNAQVVTSRAKSTTCPAEDTMHLDHALTRCGHSRTGLTMDAGRAGLGWQPIVNLPPVTHLRAHGITG